MGLVLLLIVVGLSVFATVYFVARARNESQRFVESLPDLVVPVNLLDNENAVVVSEGRGRLVFANPKARNWFDLNGSEPNLELLADAVQPSDTFLELFGKEGHASFRIGARRVEATSHYIPQPTNPQMVVVMRELVNPVYDGNALDPVQAMNVVSEITQTISGSLKLDDVLDSILKSVNRVIPFDAGEITLWDEDLQILRPLGREGDPQYTAALNSTDGVYHMDDSVSGWIARYRQPLLVTDVQARPDVQAKIKDYPFQSFVGIPLLVNDRFIGTLELGSQKIAAFDHEDMTLLQAVAGQAAIAIENAKLYQDQAERVRELSGLQQIASAITSLTDTRQMYAQLTSRIAGLMNVETCGILLHNPEASILNPQTPFFGVPDAVINLYRIPVMPGSIAQQIFAERDWWYTNEAPSSDLVTQAGLQNLSDTFNLRSVALVPMIVGNHRLGMVWASNKRDGSNFSENDVRLLSIFAAQTAAIVENAHLFDEEQRRADELGGLQQISQAIGVLRDPAELYGQISERIGKLMNVEMCGLLLLDPSGALLVSQLPFYGVDDELIRDYQIPVKPGSPIAALYSESESWISNNVLDDPVVRNIDLDRLATLIRVNKTLIAPLVAGGRRVGVVQVSNKLNGSDFTEDDARILSIFAAQGAVIIDNARLYREMRQHAHESEGLRHIAEVASSNLPMDEIIKTVVAETRQLVNSDVAAISLLNDSTGELTTRPEWTTGMDSLTQPFSIDAYAPGFQTSVLITRRAFMSNDIRRDGHVLPVYRVIAERFNLIAVIQAPLVIRERGIGELTVANRSEKEFTADDQRLVQAVAAQLAAAVERTKLYEATDADLRARIEEFDALTRVSNELNLTIELDRILEVIRHEAQRTTNTEAATVVLLRPVEEWEDATTPAIDRRLGTVKNLTGLAPIEQAVVDKEVMVVVNNYSGAVVDAYPPEALSAIASPILYGGQLAGIVHVYSERADAFPQRTQDFIKALTNQAAIAVGNALRYHQQLERSELLKQRAEQLSQIFELGHLLRSGSSIERVLEAVAHGVAEAVGFNVVLISLEERSVGVLRRVAQAGIPLTTFSDMQKVTPPIAQVESLLQPRYQISNSYFLPHEDEANWRTSDLAVTAHQQSVVAEGTQSWNQNDLLLIPLRSPAGEFIGLMSVDDPRDGKRPTLQTIEALEIFANQAAFAIENHQLVQDFQREAEAARRERDRLERLHLVASEIQRAPDIPTRLQVVADGIRAAGWGRVAITLRDVNMEPRETITSGYDHNEALLFKANLLPGIVWQQRLADPEFRRYRVGQAYFLRYRDQWVTENKLMAGHPDSNPSRTHMVDLDSPWHPMDTVYLPLYGLDRSRIIGIISMDSPVDNNPPTEASMRPIELFAAQAASAIENTRLYQETIRAAQQEARLNEVMEAIAATLDVNEIIRGMAKGLQQLIAFTRMSVALVDQNGQYFEVLRAVIDLRGDVTIQPGDRLTVDNTAMGVAFHSGEAKVYHLIDAERIPDYSDLKTWRDSGERTTMIVPMVAGGRALGAIHMGSELAEAFGFEEHLPLVSRMTNLTAVAIENARLFQQAIDRERFSAALGRVGQSVNAMLDMESVLDTVCEESINILGVAGAYIWLTEGSDLVGFAARGPGADKFIGIRRAVNTEDLIAAAVVRDHAPLYANDAGKPESKYRSALEGIGVQAILGLPLMREDRAMGVLTLVQTEPAKPFVEEDIEQASAFAVQAAIAIENARLYQETLALQSFNAAVVQSIQQGIVVLDRDMRIRTVNAFMRHNFNWSEDAVGESLFAYRPDYKDFLGPAIQNVLQTGRPESRYDVREGGRDGTPETIRNYYVYPLLEGETVSGIVLLVEDITARAALEADVEVRARQLSVLTEVSSRLTATLEPSAVVQLLFNQLGRILNYDSATLWLRQEDRLVIQAARGYADAELLIGVEAEIADSDLFREIASRGQALNIPDVTKDPRFPVTADRPMHSWLGVSLVSKGNLAGLLVLEKAEIAYYTPTMEQLALTFANQAAIALENARLFQETTRAALENTRLYKEAAERARKLDQQAQRLALLNRISEALAQSLDIENAFEVTLREMVEILGMDRGSAFLFEAEQHRARLIVEYPRRGDTPPEGIFVSLVNNTTMERVRRAVQPLVVRDVRETPEMAYSRDLLEERGVISMLIVPLAIGGQVIGSLSLDTIREARDFSPEQIEIAQTIAAQAAIAVQNASLFEQSVIRTRELETLFEATQSISVTLDLTAVLENAARQLLFALQLDNCIISDWDNVENRLLVALDLNVEGKPGDAGAKAYSLPEYPNRERALQNKQVIVMRADDAALTPAEKLLMEQRGMAYRIILPMIVREQAIGLIELESREATRALSIAETRLARTLASQAAVAIDNARLQTETASKLEELFVINELSTALSSSIEEDQIFKVVRSQLPPLIKAQSLMLAVVGEDKQMVSYPVATKDGKTIQIASHPLGDDEVSFVLKHRMPQFLAGDELEQVLNNLKITMRITNARCFLGVPMIASDEVVGALVVSDDTNARAFNLDDQRVMTTVGAQIAVSIQNSRLFARTRRFTAELEQAVRQRTEELQRERDRIDFLYRITTGLTSSLDMDMVLNRALDMMAKSVDADMGAILGIDSISDNLIYRATLNLPEHEKERIIAFSQHEGLAGWVIQSQQSVIVPDVQNDPRWLHVDSQDADPRSAIAALLEANEDILGVVMLYSRQPDHFNENQLRLITAAANQVASAMNNAELYGLIREQAERLGAMVRREQVDATKNAAIVESIADGVMVADQSGDIVQFNSAAERILGLPRQQVIGNHISTLAGLYASSGGTRWLDAVQRWLDDPTAYQPGDDVEVQLELDNGRIVSVILSPVHMGDQFLGTVSVFRDITREIEVDRMKSEFVATVSHELRTPMTSIKGYADLLLLGAAGEVSEQQQRFLSTIKTNADRLSTLVNELLDISRVDRGAVKLNLLPTDVTEVIEITANHVRGRIQNEHKDLKLVVNAPDDLPQIRADFDKITQVLNNLVDNAFSYTYPGGTVTLSARQDAKSVVISVSDTGIGIAKDKQDRIWGRFYRDEEQSLVMETSGTGLGLSIVREYVTMHGGEIWLESEVGKGTTFYVRIPVFAPDMIAA